MGVYLTSNAQYNAFDLRSPSIPERTSRPLHLRRDRLSIASIARIGVTSTASLPAEREASELPELNRTHSLPRQMEQRQLIKLYVSRVSIGRERNDSGDPHFAD
jgi:hypothetical protein